MRSVYAAAFYGAYKVYKWAQAYDTRANSVPRNTAARSNEKLTLVAWNYAEEYGTTGEGLQPSMRDIEGTMDAVTNRIAGRNATVTYTTNGEHSPNSRHYTGEAIDRRSRDLTSQQRQLMTKDLRQELGPNYRVIDEE